MASTFANCHRDPKHKPEPFKVSDFMLNFDRTEAPAQDPAAMKQLMMLLKEAQDLTLAHG